MIKKLTNQKGRTIIGLITVIISLILPLSKTCDGSGIGYIYQFGFESDLYFIGLIYILLISMLGFYFKLKILSLIFTVLGGVFVSFAITISTGGWGAPCGRTPTFFHILLLSSYGLIIESAILTAANKKKPL